MAVQDDPRAVRRARLLLALGVAAGIALSAAGLVRRAALPGASLGRGEIARVNGSTIRTEEFERLVAGLASDKRSPLEPADRARVLDRLIQEELLVQRGVEIGLVDSDPSVRKALVQAVIDSVVADAEAEEPEPETLRRFFEAHREYFGAGERLRVERLVFRDGDGHGGASARERAEAARRALLEGGEGAAAAAARLADRPTVEVPDVLLPTVKLREYLGPELVEAVRGLRDGAWSEPVQGRDDVELLRLAERRPAETPPYEAVAAQVAAEWHREQGDRALREYLELLRSDADVELAPDAPRP